AGVSLVLLVTTVVLAVWTSITAPASAIASLAGLGFTALAYGLSRTRLAFWGAVFLVFTQTILVVYIMLTSASGTALVGTTAFLILPVILATLLLDARLSDVVSGIAVVVVVVALLVVPDVTFAQYIGPFAAVVIISVLAALTSFL